MRRPMHSRYSPRFLLCLFLSILVASCDRTQQVSLTAEGLPFVPNLVQVTATLPITLSVYNAGRETPPPKSDSPGILLPPGQSIRIAMAPPPGTYLYIRRRKGRANMTGTLIEE